MRDCLKSYIVIQNEMKNLYYLALHKEKIPRFATIDRLVSTALHWFRTDLSTVLALFTTKSFRTCLSTRQGETPVCRQRQGEIFTTK